MSHIVKRAGHLESYQSEKVFYSVYPACLNASLPDTEAQRIAKAVTQQIDQWVEGRPQVSSQEIFELATAALEKQDPHAAFMYKTHRDIF